MIIIAWDGGHQCAIFRFSTRDVLRVGLGLNGLSWTGCTDASTEFYVGAKGVSRHPSVVVWAEVSGKPLGQVGNMK